MKISDLIAILNKKKAEYGKQELQFIITNKEGEIIAMKLEGQNVDIVKIAKLFSAKK